MTAGAPAPRRGALVVAIWLAAIAAALVVAWRAHYVADLSAFLPSAPTPEQAVLLDQLKSGATSRLLVIGIEGGAPGDDAAAAARAETSKKLAAALRSSGAFASIHNGESAAWADAGRFLFEHRYALSPAVDAQRFSAAGLRDAIDATVSLLGTPAGSLLKPILFRDPTGETLRIAETLTPARAPKIDLGVWVSRSAPRAVLVATTAADGADIDGQERALAAIRSGFDGAAAPGLKLVVSGAGKFAVESRERIKGEVERLALLGSIVIVVLLWLAFASLRALAVAMLPVAVGVVAGIAAVSIGFGQVHGMTLGFGTTLIGEAVDYAIYYLIQSRGGAGAAARWQSESWPTIRLGLFTSLIGFAALVFTGFSGLAQLGVFSIAGLVAAAATTRYVFPVLVPNGAPGAGFRRQLARFMSVAADRLPRWRVGVVILAAAALLALVASPSPWRGELSSLSPVSAADLAVDATLRADVGASDAGALVAVTATSEQGALEGAEAVGARLDALVAAGVLEGYDSPSRMLPSAATQLRRRAALPDAKTLAERLDEATAEGALPAARLAPFIADVAAARTQAPVERSALAATPLGATLDALLLGGDATRPWRALVNLQAGGAARLDVERVRAAIGRYPGRSHRRHQGRARRNLRAFPARSRMAGRARRGRGRVAARSASAQRATARRGRPADRGGHARRPRRPRPLRRRAGHPAPRRTAAHGGDRLELRALLRSPAAARPSRRRHAGLAAARQPDDGGVVRPPRQLADPGLAGGRHRRRARGVAVPGLLGRMARPQRRR